MDSELNSRLANIESKLQAILELLHETPRKRPPATPKKRKEKPKPLTTDEISHSRAHFASLFERWLSGNELQVHDELDALDVEALRQFADANNLNVTSKMSKSRILELVAARFREKRQLHKPPVERS